MAATPLLETKIFAPRPRRGLVARPRLTTRLNAGTESTLTVVSAPAGFGKTTLLGEWLATRRAEDRPTAWLSLDDGDNDPRRFWTYVIAALGTAVPGTGASALALLESSRTTDTALAALLNDLRAVPDDLVLVLDDYHVVEAHEVHTGLTYLLQHVPAQVHVVIATRADPPLPLARLRARRELVEIRAADLRFTPTEVPTYLNDIMGLALAADDITALNERTEGWIAALQLAALSMQGRADVSRFIEGFAGDDRYVVDYLGEEVLARQPEDVRAFLLETCILERLYGPLCDALTGRTDGRAMLESLDRRNLFLVALDDQRRWYRYHHLFAEVLRAHVNDEQPQRVKELHRRASAWYEQHDDMPQAISHALAAEDHHRAADLIEVAAAAFRRSRREMTLRRWLDPLPDKLFETRPVLALAHVGALLATGELERVEERLAVLERWAPAAGGEAAHAAAVRAGMIARHRESVGHLPGDIALARAAMARIRGDVAATVAHARDALRLTREDQQFERGGAAGMLGFAYWTNGELAAAHVAWLDSAASHERAGHRADVLGAYIAQADIRLSQGRLHDAMRIYERGLQMSPEPGGSPVRGTADMHVGLSELHIEWNDLAAARRHLTTSLDLGEANGLPRNAYRCRLVMARIQAAEGDLDSALRLTDEAQGRYAADFFPDVRPIAAIRARLWIAQGRWAKALAWARERALSVDDELAYMREFEHITLARALLARARANEDDASRSGANDLLERLLDAAEQGGRGGSVIEVLLLQALARQAAGDHADAIENVTRALLLAETEGYVRIFLDEGPAMAELVTRATRNGVQTDHARRLLAAFRGRRHRAPLEQPLVEPLSERELDVLRLLDTDLAGPDIARELVVSVATVRTHTQNIYTKLGVNNRRAAVRRADELSLLAVPRVRAPRERRGGEA